MKILLFANTDWYLYNFRLPLARAIEAQGHEVLLASPPGKYSELIVRAGFRWIAFPLVRRRLNPFAELVTVLRLSRLYIKEQPDLVHHFTVKCVLYGSLAAWLTGIKGVVNALAGLGHVFTDHGFKARLLKLVVSLISRVLLGRSLVIFQNPDDQRELLKLGLVSDDQSHLIRGSGVDISRFTPAAREASDRDLYVLLASRLLWEKGLAEYVEAARLVRQSQPDVRFLIAGDTDPGNPASVPDEAVDEWRRVGHVEVLGHCDDVERLIDKADVVVLPSYREGLPKILLEAAASGKALVATDMPGCREIVRHGINGFLVPAKNSEKLADAIKTLLLDPELRGEMGRQSRRIACEEFSEELVIAKTLAVYERALEQPSGGAESVGLEHPATESHPAGEPLSRGAD